MTVSVEQVKELQTLASRLDVSGSSALTAGAGISLFVKWI